jgi:hypothetical protein
MNAQRQVGFGVLVLGLAAGLLVSAARAEDKKAAERATGTWKSSFTTQDGQTIVTTYKLKQEGEKLTGTVTGRDGKETKIEDGKVKDDKVSFLMNRGQNGQKITIKFNGDLKGDSIKGKVEFTRGDNSRSFDWEAKREKKDK